MAFVAIPRARLRAIAVLPAGRVELGRDGVLTARDGDLRAVGIAGRCILLADPDLMRLALRAVRDGEDAAAFPVPPTDEGRSVLRQVRVLPALQECGLDPGEVAGVYELDPHDELLTITLRVRRSEWMRQQDGRISKANGRPGEATPRRPGVESDCGPIDAVIGKPRRG